MKIKKLPLAIVFAFSLSHVGSFAQTFTSLWSYISDPSADWDKAYAITLNDKGVYVAGQDKPGITLNSRWRIEKRDLASGNLNASFGTGGAINSDPSNSEDVAQAITSDASGIYVAGYQRPSAAYTQCRIEKRDLMSGALITSFGTNGAITWASFTINAAYAIATDASGIYVAGSDANGGNETQWHIEKRDKTTGALIASFGTGGIVMSNPSANSEGALAIAMDGNAIYVAGSDLSAGASDPQWRVEKRDKTTGALIATFGTGGVVTTNPTTDNDKVYAITLDASGIYLAGNDYILGHNQWRIEKRDKTTGALISAFGTGGVVNIAPLSLISEIAYGITCNAGGVYVTGSDGSLGTKGQWRTMKFDLNTGKTGCAIYRTPTTSNNAIPYAIASDTSGVYIAGINFISSNNNYQWLMEKYDLCSSFTTSLPSDALVSDEPVVAPTINMGSFTINWQEKESVHEVVIYNSIGEIVFENKYNGNTASVSLDEPNGIYFLRMRSDTGGKPSFKKIIIQH